ncbi:MAG TPA: bifunctional DNA primase/polymerase [Jatrophihabitantaceae bacterium]|jgi:hypothetical protein
MTSITASDPRRALLDAALLHAARGWRVFPLRPGDKRPAVKDWEPRATTDPARIERAWSTGAFNIGIACGPSGLVVVDLDRPKPGQAPPPTYDQPGVRDGGDVLAMLCETSDQPLPVDTYVVRTASGGTHLYYAAPADVVLRNTAGRLGWLIDTRATGGYVVAAGSTVTRHPYTALAPEVDPAPLPGWLAERLADAEPTATADATVPGVSAGSPSAYAAAALRGELDRVLAAVHGTRNHTLNAAAFALGQLVTAGLISRHLAEDALTLAGQAIGLGGRECAATIRSGLDSGERTPRQPAAAMSRRDQLTAAPDHRPAA